MMEYEQIIKSIISQQELIIGPVAIEEANKVPGLQVSQDGKTVTINNANVASAVGNPGDEVLTSRLESIIGNIPEDIFLKIDIEGSEFEVLRSTSRDMLRKAAFVVMEIHTTPEKTIEEIHYIMSQAGFDMVYQQTMRGGDSADESSWHPINVSIEKWRRV